MDTVTEFYDDFAEDYHLDFADWDSSMDHQSMVLNDAVIYLIQETVRSSKFSVFLPTLVDYDMLITETEEVCS